MFVVTIEQRDHASDWVQYASYVVKGTRDTERAMYEALYRWVQDSYHGSIRECLKALSYTSVIRVIAFSGGKPGQLKKAGRHKVTPHNQWAGGRTVNKSPVHCAACDWYGSMKQMVHKYRLNSQQEIEPADFCPECNAPLI